MSPPNLPTNARVIKEYADVITDISTDISDSDKRNASKQNSPNKKQSYYLETHQREHEHKNTNKKHIKENTNTS